MRLHEQTHIVINILERRPQNSPADFNIHHATASTGAAGVGLSITIMDDIREISEKTPH